MATNYSPAIVTDGAVFVGDALMPSTATSATTLYDRAGSYDGTMYNGTCLNFDGTDERVFTSGYFGALAGDDDVTLCAWINVDASGDMGIVSIGNVYMSIIVNGGYLEARCYNGGSVLTNTDAHAISTGTWYHVAGVFSGGNVTLYKDGVAAAAVACSNQSIAEASTGFQLGRGWTSVSIWMNGQISNPMAFNTTLSASQIKEIYQDSKVIIPSNVSQTNLKGFWTFAEGAGDICYDGSGRGIDGDFDNMESADWLTGQTGAPQLVEGYNRPMLFDGNNDAVDTNWGTGVDPSTGLTISGWVQASDASANSMWAATYKTNGDRLYLAHYGGEWDFGYKASGWSGGSGKVTAQNNVWTHYCLAMDTTSQILYINGVATITKTESGSYTLPGDMWFGRYGTTASYMFGGLVNEVIVYDTKLAIGDVVTLAATGPNGGPLPPDPTTLSTSGNIVSYWRNDGDVTWADRVGSNTGTVTGSPDALLFKQGPNGQKNVNTGRDGQGFPLKYKDVGAVGFNDTDGYIDAGTGFNHTAALTCEVWASMYTGSGVIFSQWVQDGNKRKWFIGTNTTNVLFYIDSAGSGTFTNVDGGAYPTDGKFHSYAFVYIPSVSFTAYIDGVVVGTDTSSVASSIYSSTDVNIYLGRSGAGEYWDGQIGNARIYTRALSYAEIQQNYNAQRSRFE